MSDPTKLSDTELVDLVQTVFAVGPGDQRLLVMTDLPSSTDEDSSTWRSRRTLARDWALRLDASGALRLDVDLVVYERADANNGPLPDRAWLWTDELPPMSADLPGPGDRFETLLASADIVIAPTERSATAPLKVAAPAHGLRAATMPGFTEAMIPALRVDWAEVDARVRTLADLLTEAQEARCRFAVDDTEHELTLDLRHRTGHASGGLVREPGTAGNLPSGESYIVPYEGERPGDPSRTAGVLPVQRGDEVVLYRIVGNRAAEVLSSGPESAAEAKRIADEPAYANLAELGLGVLGPFGIEPIGAVLLDEKLGPHIAFGRSDHFGGSVGPDDFTSPAAVVHQDHVYVEATQPQVRLVTLDLVTAERSLEIYRDDRYVIEL